MRSTGALAAAGLAALGLVAGLGGCGEDDGVGGVVGGPVPNATTTTVPALGGTTTSPTPGATTTAPGASVPTASAPPTTATPTGGPTTAAPSGLRLGGSDLGVTRVGAPFREAVAAVTAVLGRPTGDPPPDTSCIGAEDEAAWASFRLASSGGRVSGWVSSSTSLATPAGLTVGSPLLALRQAYGDRLQVRPPAPDAGTIFIVDGVGLGGTLTGPGASDRVTSFFNGTCETA